MSSLESGRKTVLFAIPSMGLGGSERVVLNLLRHMDPARFRLHLALLFPDGARIADVPSYVQVHDLGVRRARKAVFALGRIGRKIQADVVLSTSAHLNTAVVAARSLLPRKTALITREGADIIPVLAGKGMVGQARLEVYKRAYRRADLVVCQTDYMKHDLIRQFGLTPAKVTRIYNPVDIEQIAELAALERNPYIPPGPNLVTVGRFSHEKGFDILIGAMSLVRQAIPSASLTLVGDGPDVFHLHEAQRDLRLEDCVQFVGSRRNPYAFIRHADLLVLPSRCEALPNVVLEALALGTPVVATKCTGAIGEILSCTSLMRVASEITPESLAAEIVAAVSGRSPLPRRIGPEPRFLTQFEAGAVTLQYEHAIEEAARLKTRDTHCTAEAAA
jgi:glycosyltransferase involved in cell wall biosynthesis